MNKTIKIFSSRLYNLNHFLNVAVKHFPDDPDAMLQFRLIEDMLPLSTQIAFTCNQPHGLILWCEGKPNVNLSGDFKTIDEAKALIKETISRLETLELTDAKLEEIKHLELGPERYAEITGEDYINDYLMPNFYFHLVTAYDILRHKGVLLGKADFMRHLAPVVRQGKKAG